MLDIITKYGVSEKAGEDAWKELVQGVFMLPEGDAKAALKNAEQEWKAKFERQLPSAYRSAKSVALKALRMGIPLMCDNGTPMGKSAVEAACKAPKVEPDALSQAMLLIDKLSELMHTMDTDTHLAAQKHLIDRIGVPF